MNPKLLRAVTREGVENELREWWRTTPNRPAPGKLTPGQYEEMMGARAATTPRWDKQQGMPGPKKQARKDLEPRGTHSDDPLKPPRPGGDMAMDMMDGAGGSSFLQFYLSSELMRRAKELQRENDLMREREIAEEKERAWEREERRERERAEERARQMVERERAASQRAREDADRDMRLLLMLMKQRR